MRILVTVPWGEPLGGAEAMLESLLDGAGEAGHELEPVFLAPGPWPIELARAGFHVEVVPAGRLRAAHKWLTSVARLAGIFRRRRPEMIVNWAAKTQLYGAPAAVLAGMADRVVWWQHAIPRRGWLDGCATALPTVAIGCTSHAAATAQARLFPARPTFVVPAGTPEPRRASAGGSVGEGLGGSVGEGPISIDDATVRARPEAGETVSGAGPGSLSPRDVPVVGLVGRLQPWKGQDRLLRAHALLRTRGYRMRTVIVGGDAYGLSSAYADSLPGLIAELGLTEEVTLTGQVPDAGPYIERCDVLVNASDHEPFGIVLLEGMARAVAVVAVDAGGPREIVEHDRTGVLARSGEPAALADALEPLLASPARRRALGRAGRELFERKFTEAAMCRRFFDSLQAIADGG